MHINQASYFYRLEGRGEPIVLIAGYACDHTFWNAVFDELIKKHQVLAFDNRAVGRTVDDGAPLSLELMADETVKLFSALKITRPVIVGQSMGGMIAQIIGKKYPQAISKLILLNSAGKTNRRTLMALESFLKLLKENARIETVIETSAPWFFSPRYLENKENIAAFKKSIMNNPYPQKIEDLERQLEAIKGFDISRFSKPISVPSLLISSKEDIVCLPEECAQLAPHFLQAGQKSLQGGHSSPLEVPQEVARAILGF